MEVKILSEEITCSECPRFKKHECNVFSVIPQACIRINAIFNKDDYIWIELYKTLAKNCTSRKIALKI